MQNRIVTLSATAVMSIITLLYVFGIITNLPCGHDLPSTFARNFVHVSPLHLLANMYAFQKMTEIEMTLGSAGYLQLILILASLQTLIEMLISSYVQLNCSIGFSGVLYGLFSWSIVSQKQSPLTILGLVFLSIITASAQSSQLSLAGHLMGFGSGILVGSLQNLINKQPIPIDH